MPLPILEIVPLEDLLQSRPLQHQYPHNRFDEITPALVDLEIEALIASKEYAEVVEGERMEFARDGVPVLDWMKTGKVDKAKAKASSTEEKGPGKPQRVKVSDDDIGSSEGAVEGALRRKHIFIRGDNNVVHVHVKSGHRQQNVTPAALDTLRGETLKTTIQATIRVLMTRVATWRRVDGENHSCPTGHRRGKMIITRIGIVLLRFPRRKERIAILASVTAMGVVLAGIASLMMSGIVSGAQVLVRWFEHMGAWLWMLVDEWMI